LHVRKVAWQGGRMRKLDKQSRKTAAKGLAVGLPVVRIAKACGVHRTTLWRWIGKDPALAAARDRRAAALAAIGGG